MTTPADYRFAADILTLGKELIAPQRAWCKGAYANKKSCGTQYCAVGALEAAYDFLCKERNIKAEDYAKDLEEKGWLPRTPNDFLEHEGMREARELLYDAVPNKAEFCSVEDYNDHDGTRKAQVQRIFDKATEAAKKKAEMVAA